MRWIAAAVVLAVTAGTASAGGAKYLSVGAGPAYADGLGWSLRLEHTNDWDDDEVVFGGRIGLDMITSPTSTVITLPYGVYGGAHIGQVRTTLGGGLGLISVGRVTDHLGVGVSPFAAATLSFGRDAMVTFDGRVARQVLANSPDVTTWSVLALVGFDFGR